MIIRYPTKIFFGIGDILISHIFVKDCKYYGLGFAQIEPGEVGRQEEKYRDSNISRQVEMLFSNIKSVDVLIERLELVKKEFIKEKES